MAIATTYAIGMAAWIGKPHRPGQQQGPADVHDGDGRAGHGVPREVCDLGLQWPPT